MVHVLKTCCMNDEFALKYRWSIFSAWILPHGFAFSSIALMERIPKMREGFSFGNNSDRMLCDNNRPMKGNAQYSFYE